MLLAFGGFTSTIYRLFVLLHILCVVVGIGAVMLNGLYAAHAQRRPGPGGRAVSEANYGVSTVAEYVIYGIPVFGILAVLASDEAWKFSQAWVWMALVLFAAALAISHGVLFPGHRRINALLAEMEQGPAPAGGPPPQAVEIEALGKKQAIAGMTLNIFVVIFLYLMIWKPGA